MTSKELKKKVRDLMMANIAGGYSRLLQTDYLYIKPSPGTYPFQWFWDTCFHVIILCALKEFDLAKKNMLSLFAMQDYGGFVGHMIFWQSTLPTNKMDVLQARPTWRQLRPHTSALIQPPLVATSVLKIFKSTGDYEFINTMISKLKKYFDWLMKNRDFDGTGLISIITPFESGIDWKPSFDEVVKFSGDKADGSLYRRIIGVDFKNFIHRYNLRSIGKAGYFIVKEVIYNTFFILDLYSLAELCDIEREAQNALRYRQAAEKATASLLKLMYDEKAGAFFDVYGRKNIKSKVLTFTIFLPIILPGVSQEIAKFVINKHLNNEKEFLTKFPIPSVALSEPSFDPSESKFLWRGPTWVLPNWFLYHSLREKKFSDEAGLLLNSMLALIEKSGFREYYNPFTGEGYGAKNFTWSGLVLDMIEP